MESVQRKRRQEDREASPEQQVIDYGGAAAYAEVLRQWYRASQYWYMCNQMIALRAYAYASSGGVTSPGNAPAMLPNAVSMFSL